MSGAVAGRSRPGWAWLSGWAAGLLLIGLAGGWALREMLAPVPDVLAAPGYTLVTAEEGTVGHTLRLNTSAQWSPEQTLPNQASGTVTGVDLDDGAEVGPGEPLYTVDLRPVVVAEGEIPAFRDLSQGDRGDDVAQLQVLLNTIGYDVGDPDGRFGAAVHRAVRAWQRDLDLADDGVVRRGDVVFVPHLPARIGLEPDLVVGAALTGGEPAVQLLPETPAFTIVLPEGQARLVSPGMAVEIPRDGAVWWAEIIEVRPGDEEAGPAAVLEGADGEPVCADECEQIPLQDGARLPSLIHAVPEVSGVTVPAAALVTTAAGETAAVLDSGALRPVTVLAAASGMAVVEGIEIGEQVRTPGELPVEDEPDAS